MNNATAPVTQREQLREFLESIARPGSSFSGCNDETNLIDAGLIDSFALIQIIFFLEQSHGIKLHERGIDPQDLASIAGILSAINPTGR